MTRLNEHIIRILLRCTQGALFLLLGCCIAYSCDITSIYDSPFTGEIIPVFYADTTAIHKFLGMVIRQLFWDITPLISFLKITYEVFSGPIVKGLTQAANAEVVDFKFCWNMIIDIIEDIGPYFICYYVGGIILYIRFLTILYKSGRLKVQFRKFKVYLENDYGKYTEDWLIALEGLSVGYCICLLYILFTGVFWHVFYAFVFGDYDVVIELLLNRRYPGAALGTLISLPVIPFLGVFIVYCVGRVATILYNELVTPGLIFTDRVPRYARLLLFAIMLIIFFRCMFRFHH